MPIIYTDEDMTKALNSIDGFDKVAYDLETTGLFPYKGDQILGVAFGSKESNYYYLPLRHEVGNNASMHLLNRCRFFLDDEDVTLITWNGKFDLHFTKAAGLPIRCKVIDVMLNAHLYDENAQPFKLKEHGKLRLGESATDEEDELIRMAEIYLPKLLSRLRSRKSKLDVIKGNLKWLPLETVAEYAMKDLDLTERLDDWYDERLSEETYYRLIPQLGEYSKILMKMEENGLLIDIDKTKEYSLDAASCMQEIIQEIFDNTGFELNPNSWMQVKNLLLETSPAFNRLPEWEQKTDEGTLSKLDDPIANLVTEYHKWSKVKGTYYDMFLDMVDDNNVLHYSVKAHGTVSSRLSCPKPAIQTIPRISKKNEMYRVKDCVISRPGYSLVECDFSQLELRLSAHFAKEPTMMKAYAEGRDLHTVTAELLGISRQDAKPVNFGFLYGSGAESFKAFAEDNYGLKLSLNDAKMFRKKFFDTYPGLVIYNKTVVDFATRAKYIRMLTGRKRHFNDERDYHKALNYIIQGSGAEILRVSMTRLNRNFEQSLIETPRILLQVHDSLMFEIRNDLIDYWLPKIQFYMTDFQLRVPLKIEAKQGNRWNELKDYAIVEEEVV